MFGSYRSTSYPQGQTLRQIEAGAAAEELLASPTGGYKDSYWNSGFYAFVVDGRTFTSRDGIHFLDDDFRLYDGPRIALRLHSGPASETTIALPLPKPAEKVE